MWIERLVVGGCGPLRPGLELRLRPGLNLLLAPNEAGKTSLGKLVAGLLYGFGNGRNGERSLQPWSGEALGGEMWLTDSRQASHHLRRHMLAKRETCTLGGSTERPMQGEEPGRELLGMERGVFLNLCLMGQHDLARPFGGQGGKPGAEALRRLSGLFVQRSASAWELGQPLEVLQQWRTRREALFSTDARKGALGRAQETRLRRTGTALAQARERERRMAVLQHELAEMEGRRQVGKRLEELGDMPGGVWALLGASGLCLAGGVALLAAAGGTGRLLGAAGLVLAGLLAAWAWVQRSAGASWRRKRQDLLAGAARMGLDPATLQRGVSPEREEALVGELAELSGMASLDEAMHDHDVALRQWETMGKEHDTLLLAETLLERALQAARLDAQPQIMAAAQEYLSLVTGGAYSRMSAAELEPGARRAPRMAVRRGEGQSDLPTEALSQATREQVHFCLRLALAREHCGDGPQPFLWLDDPFVAFDDARLEATMELLARVSRDRQVVLMTCQERQARAMLKAGQVNRISLG